MTWFSSAGSVNSSHSRGKSRSTSRLRGSSGSSTETEISIGTAYVRRGAPLRLGACDWVCSTSGPTPCICWWSTPTTARTRGRRTRRRPSCGWPSASAPTASSPRPAPTRCARPRAKARDAAATLRDRGPAGVRHLGGARRVELLRGAAPGARGDRGRPAGALRRGRGDHDVPRRAAVVRLVGRAAAGPRHRRRLAGDRRRHRRGARPRAVAAAGRRPAHPRPAQGRPARRRRRRRRPGRGAHRARRQAHRRRSRRSWPDAGWDRPVATSKTFRTLARLAGAAPSAPARGCGAR